MPLDHIRGSLGLEMDTSPSPSHPEVETVTSVNTITPVLATSSAPSWHFPLIFSYSYGNPCGFRASAPVYNNVAIASINPNRPTIPSTFTTSKTYHVGEDIMESGGTRFIR